MSTLFVRRTRALPAILLLLSMSAIAQAAPQAATPTHVVIVPVANMYSGPSEDTDVVSQAIYSSNVAALDDKGDWIQIRTADDYKGWARAKDLKKLSGAPYGEGASAVQVTSLSANVYREPNVTKHAPLITVPFDATLVTSATVANGGGRWLKVALPDGREGYVQTGDVAAQSSKLTIPEDIELTRKFLGVTYTWGGTSSFGYDCSGFMQMLMKHRGYTMPRDADIQAAWTNFVPVERKDLQPGDLLYFGSSAQHITHTGMYIGGGMFIHDTTNTHPMVQISKLDDQPWTKLLVAQRRLK